MNNTGWQYMLLFIKSSDIWQAIKPKGKILMSAPIIF